MGRRRKKRTDVNPDDPAGEEFPIVAPPRPILIVGAGAFLHDLIGLLNDYPEFQVAGILDPAPHLKGQMVDRIPVVGWLGDIPDSEISAVIGTPASPDAFDRGAVFHILQKRGVHLPTLRALDTECARDVSLNSGALLLAGCVVEEGAVIGRNCLVGPGCRIGRHVELDDHTVMMPDSSRSYIGRDREQKIQPRSLAATIALENDSIQEVIRKIGWACMEIVLITDRNRKLTGTVTDGDIRRGILAGVNLQQPISAIMNRNPVSVPLGTSRHRMLELMRAFSIRHLPVVDNNSRPIRLEVMEVLLDNLKRQEAVVMAGGLGARLRPFTKKTPKPLLSVAGQPILDHILSGLRSSGLQDIVLSVNYLGDAIRKHVGDGHKHDLNVAYLCETQRLGTAGALSLLHPRPKRPFLVMNGDLLTNLDFAKLLKFQRECAYDLVLCVKKQKIAVPYGVVDIENGVVSALREKPVYEHFINAGIYVLKPASINLVPRNTYFDMTDLVNVVLRKGGTVGAFPIIEYWRDIGTPADLNAADTEYVNVNSGRATPAEPVAV